MFFPGGTMTSQPAWGYELWLEEQLQLESERAALITRSASGETILASPLAHSAAWALDETSDLEPIIPSPGNGGLTVYDSTRLRAARQGFSWPIPQRPSRAHHKPRHGPDE
jgi:hypothetical protein